MAVSLSVNSILLAPEWVSRNRVASLRRAEKIASRSWTWEGRDSGRSIVATMLFPLRGSVTSTPTPISRMRVGSGVALMVRYWNRMVFTSFVHGFFAVRVAFPWRSACG